MGFRRPTDVQRACIPSILDGKDVMGCAETGSGKTAAFALPILHKLSIDPYGIYAVVLTPTRELALQISEQFSALGAPMGLRVCLVIGGVNMTEQSTALSRRPHVVIATPGRLRHHIEGADPPNLSRAVFLVLDEADRLLASGFEAELKIIMQCMHKQRQTLLFSATLTESLKELEAMSSKNTLRFDLTLNQKIPTQLIQEYLFMPAQLKLCYLVAFLQGVIKKQIQSEAENEEDDHKKIEQQRLMELLDIDSLGGSSSKSSLEKGRSQSKKKSNKKKNASSDGDDTVKLNSSIMIFVGTCKKCQEIAETLLQLRFDCVALHSMMNQNRRLASLAKFKSRMSPIMVSTDVASRGLDIPTVDIVINLDLPKIAVDYVHRVGRTARAGRGGRAISLISQYDIKLVHTIEEFTGQKLVASTDVAEEDVVKLLNTVSKAMKEAQLGLLKNGFDEQVEIFSKRKDEKRKKRKRSSNDEGAENSQSDS